jgi:Tol biopolymer transport system component
MNACWTILPQWPIQGLSPTPSQFLPNFFNDSEGLAAPTRSTVAAERIIEMAFRTFRGIHTGLALLTGLGLWSVDLGAGPKYSDWSPATNLGSGVNSAAEDFAPHISKNGLSLYFASTRPGGLGGEDLWVSKRSSIEAPWGEPMNLGSILNSDANERSPGLSRDGRHLYFATTRPGGSGGFDIWVSWRHDTRDDLGWQTPVNLGAQFNSVATDAGPAYFENDEAGVPLLFLASNRAGGAGGLDIYVSELTASGSFGPPVLVNELSGALNDLTPGVRHDGLELFIASNRLGSIGAQDLWVSSRGTAGDPWLAPVNPGPALNSSGNDNFPSVSSDRETLFFSSDRPGGSGGLDIYVSTRSKRNGPR